MKTLRIRLSAHYALFAMIICCAMFTSCQKETDNATPAQMEEGEGLLGGKFSKQVQITDVSGENALTMRISSNNQQVINDITNETYILEKASAQSEAERVDVQEQNQTYDNAPASEEDAIFIEVVSEKKQQAGEVFELKVSPKAMEAARQLGAKGGPCAGYGWGKGSLYCGITYIYDNTREHIGGGVYGTFVRVKAGAGASNCAKVKFGLWWFTPQNGHCETQSYLIGGSQANGYYTVGAPGEGISLKTVMWDYCYTVCNGKTVDGTNKYGGTIARVEGNNYKLYW